MAGSPSSVVRLYPGSKTRSNFSGGRRDCHVGALLAGWTCCYEIAALGTATILTTDPRLTGATGFWFSGAARWVLSDAPQMIPLTRAMLRLIERIRWADRRMTTPPGVEVCVE